MARGFGATLGVGTTDDLTTGLTSDNTTRSISLWTNRNGAGGSSGGRLFSKGPAGTQTIDCFNSNVNTTYQFNHRWSGANGTWTVPQPALSSWVNYIVTYDYSLAVNVPVIYLNGISQTVTTSIAGSGTITTDASPYVVGNIGGIRVWDGMHAEFAVWDRILSQAEATAIGARRYSPLFFPANLVEYVPCIRDLTSLKTTAPTVTGTAVQPHPPIIYPTYAQARFLKTVAPYSAAMFQAMLQQTQGGAAMIGRTPRGVYG